MPSASTASPARAPERRGGRPASRAHLGGRHVERARHESVGERRQPAQGFLHRHEPPQVPQRKSDDLAPPDAAQHVAGASGAGFGERLANARREVLGAARAAEGVVVRQPPGPLGMADQHVREERARSESPGEEPHRLRSALVEHREDAGPAAARVDETLEPRERRVGIRHGRKRWQKRGEQPGEHRPRLLVWPDRPQLAGRPLGVLEPVLPQHGERGRTGRRLEERSRGASGGGMPPLGPVQPLFVSVVRLLFPSVLPSQMSK